MKEINNPNKTDSEMPGNQKFILPIRVGIEPMKHLLIVNFKNDPEFEALEPQIFDDDINGKGIRVLRYRKDKKIDVYWQPGVYVHPGSFSIGKGIGDFTETHFEIAELEIDDHSVYTHCSFTDIQGRKVDLLIKNYFNGKRGFPFLAPVGNEIDNPKQLFLVYMLGFDFLHKKGTEIQAKIGNRKLRPAGFPILRNFRSVFFLRYCAEPVVGTLNAPMTSPVVFNPSTGGGCIEIDGMNLTLDEEGKVKLVSHKNKQHVIEVEFEPGFPSLSLMISDSVEKGKFTFRIAGVTLTGGTFSLLRKNNHFDIELNVTEKWIPKDIPFSLKIVTSLLQFFRNWPATYRWRGSLDLDDKMIFSGAWERKKLRSK